MSPRAQFVALCLLLALSLISAAPASAQLIKVEGGASDVFDADGGQIEFQSRDYRGYTSVGEIQGHLLFGSYLTTVFNGYNFVAGDSPISLDLPTDIFDSSHYIVTRGISASHKFGDADLFVFGGESAIAEGTPFFQAASNDSPTAMAFLRKPLSKSLTFFSRNVIAKDNTSIQGLDWKPSNWLHAAASGGIGSGSSYAALASDFEHRWLSLKLAYIAAGDRFRRFTVQTPLSSEVTGANALLTLHPRRDLIVVAGHQNYLQPQVDSATPSQKATVNDIQTDWTSRYLQLGGGVFDSSVEGRHGLAEAIWASRHIIRNIDGGVNFFRSQSGSAPASNSLTGTIRETLGPRLSLLEIVGRSAGQNQFLMGGTFISNFFSIDINYQTIFLPYRTNPFQQGLAATIQLHPPGDIGLTGETFVGGDGKLHYTAFGSKMFERAFGWLGGPGGQQTYHFARLVIKGKVVDDQKQPVPGVALQIGKELVMTNQDGEFFLRTSRREPQPLQVAFDQFINPTPLELRSAPRELTPEPEDSAIGVTIVLAHPAAPQEPHQ